MTGSNTASYTEIKDGIDEEIGGKADASLREAVRDKAPEAVLYGFAVVFVLYHAWYAVELPYPRARAGIVHLGLVLAGWGGYRVAKLENPLGSEWYKSVAYTAHALLSVGASYYIFSNYMDLLRSAGRFSQTDIRVGMLIIVLLLIALWFVSRLIFAITMLGFAYALFGPYFPGFLSHQGLSLERTVTMVTVEFRGIYGTILQIVATWVVPFILLAGLFEAMDGMATAIKGITKSVARRPYIQVGQIAVFASMIFGSINGTTVANIASTGSVTIPLMKQNDYPPRLAAAIEAVASTGGQTLPPVMGTAAFLMAELIRPGYSDIIVAAVVPSLVFYFAIAASIWVYSDELSFRQKTITDIPNKRPFGRRVLSFFSNYDFILALVVLLYWLVYVRANPMLAGMYALITLVGLRLVKRLELGVRNGDPAGEARSFVREFLFGCRDAVETMVRISVLVVPLGIVIRALVVTGFAQSISGIIINAAGGNEILIVLFAAAGAIMFGLGMPTLIAYLLVSLFIAPTMTEVLAAGQLEIHMFVFYYALVSSITPPIAIGILVAQGISDSKFLPTASTALKIGFPFYILPILFLYQDLLGTGPVVFLTGFLVLAGFVALSIAVISTRLTRLWRSVLGFLAGLLIFVPNLPVKLALAGLLLSSFGYRYRKQLRVALESRGSY